MDRKRRIRRLVVGVVLFLIAAPFLGFGLSNLYLVSPKGREFVSAKIGRRIGLETSLKGSSWSPWNGLTLYGIRVEQPVPLSSAFKVPLLTVESVRIDPVWGALLKNRQLMIRRANIRKPKINAPIELLSQIPASPPPAPNVAGETAGVSNPPDKPGQISEPATSRVITGTASPPVTKVPAAEKSIASAEGKKPLVPPTVWINFFDADLRILSSLTKEPLYEISKANGGLPLGGRPAQKNTTLKLVKCLGNTIGTDLSIPLRWASPVLGIGGFDGALFGMDCSAKAEIALTNGIPFRIAGVIPAQQNRDVRLGKSLHAQLTSVSGQGIFQGFLALPASWQGQCILNSASLDATIVGNNGKFDYAKALVVFRNGALSCVDARMVGDSMSLLGNATVLTDGRAAANARIIAPPESLHTISKMVQPGSSTTAFLTTLSTPQRSALDMQVFGKIGKFFYKPNPRAAPIPLQ